MTKKQLLRIVAQRCKQARERAGLYQSDVAKHLLGRDGKPGVDREFVSQIEAGETMPSVHNLRILAGLYDVTTDHLLGNDPPPKGAKRTRLKPLAALLMGASLAGVPTPGKAELLEGGIHYANRRRRPKEETNEADKKHQCRNHPTSLRPASLLALASRSAAL